MTYYLPRFRYQIGDPTTTRDAFICTMSSGAMVLDYHTRGRISVWGGTLEKHQNDHTGGTDLYDLAVAWRWYGQELTQGSGGWPGVKAGLAAGRAVVLQGDYDRFTGGNSCQPGFTGDHAIALFPSRTVWALVGDPLCDGFKTIPETTVRTYAEKLNPHVQFAMSQSQLEIELPANASALGATKSGTYTTETKVQALGKYVTWKMSFGAAAAGKTVGILVATKNAAGVWSPFVRITGRLADTSGDAYFWIYKSSAAWISVRGDLDGVLAPARQARWK